MKALLPLIWLLVLTACSASGPVYRDPSPPKSGMATVILYRMQSNIGSAHVKRYFVNGTWTASLRSGGYTSFEVKAGTEQVFGVGSETAEAFSFVPEAGQTYYAREWADVQGYTTPSGYVPPGWVAVPSALVNYSFVIVSEQEARRHLGEMKFNPPYTKLPLEGL